MKRLLLTNSALLALCAPGVWAQRAPAIHSPDIAADRSVIFRLAAPNAAEVILTGEFMKGGKPLVKDSAGVWSVTVGPIEPEIYYYNFTIDGVRTIDPANPDVKTGSTATTISSVLEVKGDRPAFYDGQPVPHGEIHTNWYQSKALGALRRVRSTLRRNMKRIARLAIPCSISFTARTPMRRPGLAWAARTSFSIICSRCIRQSPSSQ